eukprot:gene13691-13813_t
MASTPPVAWYEQLLAAVQKQIQTHLVQQQQGQRRSAHQVLTQGQSDQQLWLQQPDHSVVQVSHAQAAGIAWALGRMALLPSQHDQGVSLVPSGAWLSQLYAAAGAGSSAGAAALRIPQPAATQQQRQQVNQLHRRRTHEAGQVVRLMWAAAVCDFNPGDGWWRHAEQRLLLLLQHSQLPVPAGPQQAALTSGEEATGRPDHPDKMLGDVQDPSTSNSQLPTRLLGALVQAYGASGRNMPSPVRQHLVMTAGVIQQLQHEPVTNALRLLRALSKAGGHVDQGWLLHLAAAFQLRLARLAPKELPQLVHCLAEAGLDLQQLQGVKQAEQGLIREAQQEGAAARGAAAAFDGASWQQACWSVAWNQLPLMTATDVSLLLWGCAKMQAKPPPAWLAAVLQHMQLQFPAAKPSDLALGIDALSRLGYRPSADWLGGFMMATHRKFAAALSAVTLLPHDDVSSRRHVLVVQHILQCLWALAALQAPPNPRWLKHLLLLVYRQLPLLQPRHIAVLMLTLARLRCRPSPQFMQCMLDKLDDCSTCRSLDLLHVVYSAAVLRWQPNRQWLDKFLVTLGSRLGELSPRGVALCHWSLGVLRVVPPETWRRAAISAVSVRLAEFDALSLGMLRGSYSATSLVHMLAGVAKMHLTPGQAWLQDMVTQGSPEKLSVLNGYELQQLLWALAHLQYKASPAWLNMVQLLLEIIEHNVPLQCPLARTLASSTQHLPCGSPWEDILADLGVFLLMRSTQYAVVANWPAGVEALLAAGASVHTRSPAGDTALLWAAYKGLDVDVVQALLSAGADVNVLGDVVHLLLTAGALVHERNDLGNTPLQLARSREVRDMMTRMAEAPEERSKLQQELQLYHAQSIATRDDAQQRLLELRQQAEARRAAAEQRRREEDEAENNMEEAAKAAALAAVQAAANAEEERRQAEEEAKRQEEEAVKEAAKAAKRAKAGSKKK